MNEKAGEGSAVNVCGKEGKEFRDKTRNLASWGSPLNKASDEIARHIKDDDNWRESEECWRARELSPEAMAEIEDLVEGAVVPPSILLG